MNAQSLLTALTQTYEFFDSLNLSVTAWVVIGLLLAVVALLALREAAAWFFKIDDIKKDVKKMRQAVIDMEAEVRSLQSLLSQNVKLAETTALTARSQAASPTPGSVQASAQGSNPRFPVNH